VTFFDPGFSIIKLRRWLPTVKDVRLFSPQDWFDSEAFVRLNEPPGYRQLRMEPVAESFGKTYADQQKLLPEGEEVPPARCVLMGMAIHFLATGERLFPRFFVRCKDLARRSCRVYVGNFGAYGWFVDFGSDDGRSGGVLGLASARTS
jgi:hypothetical protein